MRARRGDGYDGNEVLFGILKLRLEILVWTEHCLCCSSVCVYTIIRTTTTYQPILSLMHSILAETALSGNIHDTHTAAADSSNSSRQRAQWRGHFPVSGYY